MLVLGLKPNVVLIIRNKNHLGKKKPAYSRLIQFKLYTLRHNYFVLIPRFSIEAYIILACVKVTKLFINQ